VAQKETCSQAIAMLVLRPEACNQFRDNLSYLSYIGWVLPIDIKQIRDCLATILLPLTTATVGGKEGTPLSIKDQIVGWIWSLSWHVLELRFLTQRYCRPRLMTYFNFGPYWRRDTWEKMGVTAEEMNSFQY